MGGPGSGRKPEGGRTKPYGQEGASYRNSLKGEKAMEHAAKIAKKYGPGSKQHIKAMQKAIKKMPD